MSKTSPSISRNVQHAERGIASLKHTRYASEQTIDPSDIDPADLFIEIAHGIDF